MGLQGASPSNTLSGQSQMTLIITQDSTSKNGRYLEITDGKQTAQIWHGESYTSVRVVRDHHRNFGTGGKVFHDENRFEQALLAYKSGAVRSMLSLAKSLVESV